MARLLRVGDLGKCIGCYNCMFACAREVMGSYSPLTAAIRIRTGGGYHSKMAADVCRACREPACAAACEEGALRPRKAGGVRFVSGQCTRCGKCGEACPIKYLEFNPVTGQPIVCRHCGVCANYCPHGVLTMEEVNNAQPGIHQGAAR
ncbi:MAG: (Fe-S)-binding protein [Syntrophomonadaceae bacterium]|nr:(Fe-S)-binding protein [Syntrophomonadaceae bacterium]